MACNCLTVECHFCTSLSVICSFIAINIDWYKVHFNKGWAISRKNFSDRERCGNRTRTGFSAIICFPLKGKWSFLSVYVTWMIYCMKSSLHTRVCVAKRCLGTKVVREKAEGYLHLFSFRNIGSSNYAMNSLFHCKKCYRLRQSVLQYWQYFSTCFQWT